MMRAWLAGGLCWSGMACSPSPPQVAKHVQFAYDTSTSCPEGYTRDAARTEALRALLRDADEADGAALAAQACFGDAEVLGVFAADVALLDRHGQDPALAARLVHLAVHQADGLGDGCAQGLERALASEARAVAQESRLRARWGLAPLAASHAAEADYTRRCRAP